MRFTEKFCTIAKLYFQQKLLSSNETDDRNIIHQTQFQMLITNVNSKNGYKYGFKTWLFTKAGLQ